MTKRNVKSLGWRMKRYEGVSKNNLINRVPVIMRIDGRAFHTFTKGLTKPFDPLLMHTMQITASHLCKAIQGAKMAYVQSDEISILITDYDTRDSEAWFGYSVQKMTSVAASIATLEFNDTFRWLVENKIKENINFSESVRANNGDESVINEIDKTNMTLLSKLNKATFDCRVFNIPENDVDNYFLWRQQDAERNSINSLAQSVFSHKELQGISCKDLQNKLFTERGINWNNCHPHIKRGTVMVKNRTIDLVGREIHLFKILDDTPQFKDEKDYCLNLLKK